MGGSIHILGAGFAALAAARTLRRLSPTTEITLIAPKAEFVYLPSLIWIPSGLRRGEDLIRPLQPLLDRLGVKFIAASVTGLKEGGRTVMTDQGEFANEALVIATGGRFLKKLPGIEHALTLCEGVAAAEALRERLKDLPGGHIACGFGGNPQEPGAMRGGPMFELLFALDTQLRREGRRNQFELSFFNAGTEPGKRLGSQTVTRILAHMQERQILTYLGQQPLGFSASQVQTETTEIPADLILFMPGLGGPEWLANSPLPRSPGGFVQADAYCRVEGLKAVYVAGDAGSYPGPDWLPKQAHMAELQARAAAANLLDERAGKPATARPRAELLCIIDSLEAGMLVYRSEQRNISLPSSRAFHWAKRAFERRYLAALQG